MTVRFRQVDASDRSQDGPGKLLQFSSLLSVYCWSTVGLLSLYCRSNKLIFRSYSFEIRANTAELSNHSDSKWTNSYDELAKLIDHNVK